jgi:hypothetical protein
VGGLDEARFLCGQDGKYGKQARFGFFAVVKAADVLIVK